MNLNKISVLLLVSIAISSCAPKSPSPKIIRPVKLYTVESLESFEKSFSGVVSPDEYSNLAFKMGGYITSMNVVDGQRVRKGEIVAQIDPQDFQLQYDAQSAAYTKAKSQSIRAKKLLEKDAISQHEAESFEAAYVGAESAYRASQITLDETRLIAPFDGFIQKKYVESHQRVQSGEPIVCLINPNALQVQFTIPETNIEYISKDSKLYVEFDAYRGERFEAAVKEYVEASPDGAGVPVYLKITDPKFDLSKYNISVGFSCRVGLTIESSSQYTSALTVPLSAIILDNETGKKSIFCYNPKEQIVEKRFVSDNGVIVGRDKIIVEGDLKAGESVVAAGASYLTDGQKVKVLSK
ncbi:MAG: efflux RND transporter periplasmic adaptor subunit [Rikenellaceae bacterium]